MYCVFRIPNVTFGKSYEENVYKCIGFLYENYQQQAYIVL